MKRVHFCVNNLKIASLGYFAQDPIIYIMNPFEPIFVGLTVLYYRLFAAGRGTQWNTLQGYPNSLYG